jgi:hypothetical protein
MRHDYEIFEKFADGSTIWRAVVSGRFDAQRKIQELSERSQNEFVAIDVKAGKFVPVNLLSSNSGHRARTQRVA